MRVSACLGLVETVAERPQPSCRKHSSYSSGAAQLLITNTRERSFIDDQEVTELVQICTITMSVRDL